jgi:hypothetical protein
MNAARKTLLMVALAAGSGCGGARSDPSAPLEAARNPQGHDTRRGDR